MIPSAIIVAGGSGKRMKTQLPKQFLPLRGEPILIHTLRRFLDWNQELQLALVLPQAHGDTFVHLASKHLEEAHLSRIHLCQGGESRTASVWAGLDFLWTHLNNPEGHLVGIHDGVRPFIEPPSLTWAFTLAEEKGSAVVSVAVKTSLRRRMKGGDSVPVDREEYVEVQTPQVFRLKDIHQAFQQRPHDAFTDDASLYQEMGGQIFLSEGSYDNIKITTPEDLAVGEEILARQGL